MDPIFFPSGLRYTLMTVLTLEAWLHASKDLYFSALKTHTLCGIQDVDTHDRNARKPFLFYFLTQNFSFYSNKYAFCIDIDDLHPIDIY